MEVSGQLKVKYHTQKVSDKFSKRDFVLATDLSTPYPQFISFQTTQDKCSELDKFNQGDEIKVHFNLRGREWSGPQGIKYFNTLEAWRIELVSKGNSEPTENKVVNGGGHIPPQFNSSITDNNDLPF
jgi:hypothetical protein